MGEVGRERVEEAAKPREGRVLEGPGPGSPGFLWGAGNLRKGVAGAGLRGDGVSRLLAGIRLTQFKSQVPGRGRAWDAGDICTEWGPPPPVIFLALHRASTGVRCLLSNPV